MGARGSGLALGDSRPPAASSALFPPHKVPWSLSAVSPFVDPAQLLVLQEPAHALHKRFTCVRWPTPLLDGTLTLYTPHFRSMVRAPYVHLMTKKNDTTAQSGRWATVWPFRALAGSSCLPIMTIDTAAPSLPPPRGVGVSNTLQFADGHQVSSAITLI